MSISVKRLLNVLHYDEGNDLVFYYSDLFCRGRGCFVGETKESFQNDKYLSQIVIHKTDIKENEVYFIVKFATHLILFNNSFYEVKVSASESEYTKEELAYFIKEKIYKANKKFEQIKKQVQLYEKFETKNESERREPISEEVRFEVWRRDGGKCVICGSQKNLEFDHIIPFSKGGSSTARNIQLLCQDCNRKKSDKI